MNFQRKGKATSADPGYWPFGSAEYYRALEQQEGANPRPPKGERPPDGTILTAERYTQHWGEGLPNPE